MRGVAVINGRVIGIDRRARTDLGPPLGVGRAHALEADQMQAWTGNPRGESLHQFQG
jgi:hypothetical protein